MSRGHNALNEKGTWSKYSSINGLLIVSVYVEKSPGEFTRRVSVVLPKASVAQSDAATGNTATVGIVSPPVMEMSVTVPAREIAPVRKWTTSVVSLGSAISTKSMALSVPSANRSLMRSRTGEVIER